MWGRSCQQFMLFLSGESGDNKAFIFVELLGWFGTSVILGQSSRQLITTTLFHTLFILKFSVLLLTSTLFGEVFGLQLLVRFEIWRHRNKFIFKGAVTDHYEIFTLVQLKILSWVTFKIISACFSYTDWCLNLLACMYLIKRF